MKKLIGISLLLGVLLAVPQARADVSTALGVQTTTPGTYEGSHIFSGSKIFSISVTWHTMAARWLMIFDATSVPGSGALSAASPLKACQYVQGTGTQADGTQNFSWLSSPLLVRTGVVVVLSTNAAGCSSLTPDGANNWFGGQVQ